MPKDRWKRQTWWSLPIYTGDVSGVCSALYELGGMVVMHDPSGCNSTYNTHDEIRWTTKESLIFLSGLTQLDAITGNDRKLVDDIVSAAKQFHPAFIAIANSPVPWLIGTDFAAICRKVHEETQIPAFYIETNAMHDYTRGAGLAFLELAKMLFSGEKAQGLTDTETASDSQGSKIRINVLGVTPLDYTVMSQIDVLRTVLEREGFEVVSVWGIGDSLEHLARGNTADVNLVLSSAGIYTARWMEETFRIPYVASVPTGALAARVFSALRDAAESKTSSVPYLEILKDAHSGAECKRCAVGEPVTMGSAAADMTLRDRMPVDLIPLTETVNGLILEDMRLPSGEQEIIDILSQYEDVTADPMLETACQENCHYTAWPHLALSGRLYLDQIKPLITDQNYQG